MLRSAFLKATALTVAVVGGSAALAQDLPRTMVWTSYDLGSTGYVEASAMADALDKQFGTTVRITPSGTGVGRLLPLRNGRANFGFMGNEILFAAEGSYEFAEKDWGPQDTRVILGRPAAVGLITGNDTDHPVGCGPQGQEGRLRAGQPVHRHEHRRRTGLWRADQG